MKQREIAVYGKGGIGKSTISANLSAALAAAGVRVLQIGCDPKHDSTRLLTEGREIPTVLDYLRDVPKDRADIDRVLYTGIRGIGCVEAGGPKPGVGCAGRGIISAFEFLERNRVKEKYDILLYDVLGDVVCGGFAVPIRREYADMIFLVTSGEFMSLYAANNILRGIRSYDGGERRRVAGIIFNARDLPEEETRTERFAKGVELPIVARVPRSEAFAAAERQKRPVTETAEYPAEGAVFRRLAAEIIAGLPLFEARPLSDEDLERLVLGGETDAKREERSVPAAETAAAAATVPGKTTATAEPRPPAARPALYGCAFTGAATTAVHLTDAAVIAHAPRSCAFFTWQNISSPGRKNLFHRGILMPSALSPRFECTEIDRHEAVFGGTDKLRRRVKEAAAAKPGAVIVVSSCVSGIIGDDVLSVESLSTPETPVIVIKADGDIGGDYMEGIDMCLYTLAEKLIDPSVPPRPLSVNVIGETGVAYDLDVNYRTVKGLLERMGIEINCRFLGGARTEEVRRLTAAPLNLLASDGEDNQKLRAWLERRYGCRFLDGCIPVGFRETRRFLEQIGEFFDRKDRVLPVLREEQQRYDDAIRELRPKLAGKRILMTTINTNMDWLLETATAARMEFVWVGVLNYLRKEMKITDFPERYPVIEEVADWPAVMEKIRRTKPDLVLSNYTSAVPPGDYLLDNMPMTQQAGFHAGIHTLRRWATLAKNEREGDWIRDRRLFETYFS
ncbi:MAG: nitrogenase component 1 [Bacillota bacterium]|jgi:nitrogenase iron protein NifH